MTPRKLRLSHNLSSEVGLVDTNRELTASPPCTPFLQCMMSRLPMSTAGTPLVSSHLYSCCEYLTINPVNPELFLRVFSFGSKPWCVFQGLCSYAEDISDAEKVYHECQQEGPITFEQCIPLDKMKFCKKIGEGTFGEVFSTVNDSMETVALKIIPIEGDQKVNGEDQKTFGEILHEIIISKELSSLGARENNRTQGFIALNNLHCVQGSYPNLLLAAWDKFDKQRMSENDRPDFFPDDQLFLILEFEFGGCDLENLNCKLSSLAQAKSILHQVTIALAVAEQALCFEHRDLHWGNILVKNTTEKKGTYILNRVPHNFETNGVLVNIIDYSLSRLEIDGLTVSCDISADEELFMGQGDYQFDIYRKMREENNNSWSEYNPHTNVLWLHYLADKLLHMNYKSKSLSKPMKVLKKNMTNFYHEVLGFKCAASVLEGSSLFK
uniref:Serine/threonine-protein kinase haspin n=1 Tax=Scleropages formosus TaxID=113540 RepID=A0A8D0CNC1_SCLFO